jgi:hypothetical protein
VPADLAIHKASLLAAFDRLFRSFIGQYICSQCSHCRFEDHMCALRGNSSGCWSLVPTTAGAAAANQQCNTTNNRPEGSCFCTPRLYYYHYKLARQQQM